MSLLQAAKVELDLKLADQYMNKKRDSDRRCIPFLLPFSQYKLLKTRKTCYYTGLHFQKTGALKRTLDRKDCNLGYTVENTVACCHQINKVRSLFENHPHINIDNLKMAVRLM